METLRWGLLHSPGRMTFGIVCLILALVLALGLGLSRLLVWRRRRRRPDLRQRGGGTPYSGERSRAPARRHLPLRGTPEHYTGTRRREKRRYPTQEIASHKGGGLRPKSHYPVHTFWNPSYKGKKLKR